jgi:hypothetical protein
MKMDHMDEVGNLHNMNNNVDEIGKTYPTNGHMDEIFDHIHTKVLNCLTLLVIRFIEFQ